MYNTMKKIWACKIDFFLINTCIQQEWIKLMTQTLNGSVYLKKS